MALTSNKFSDITEGLSEDEQKELIENGGTPDFEKLCLVQEFIPDCQELGTHLLSSLNIDQDALMKLEDRDEAIKETVKNIDSSMYEKAALLCWVTGEKDGNAGNFLISEVDSKTNLRSIYKIDCAASFAENNDEITTGLVWAGDVFEEEMSSNLKAMIKNINPDNIASLMLSRNKSEASIEAMRSRVQRLKLCANEEDWAITDTDYKLT